MQWIVYTNMTQLLGCLYIDLGGDFGGGDFWDCVKSVKKEEKSGISQGIKVKEKSDGWWRGM